MATVVLCKISHCTDSDSNPKCPVQYKNLESVRMCEHAIGCYWQVTKADIFRIRPTLDKVLLCQGVDVNQSRQNREGYRGGTSSVITFTIRSDLGMDEDDDEAVPLPNVNAAILKKVIQWCTYHKDDPPPPEDDENKEKRTDDISSWDAEFLKVDQGTLFELILVSISLC